MIGSMIRRLEGQLVDIYEDNLVISCGGVGYKVWATSGDLKTLKGASSSNSLPIIVWTHHAIRETSHDLYGFVDKKDLEFFELLITVSGIGPKTALGLLTTTTAPTLRKGIISGDSAYLSKTSGIGKKTAEKIVFELSGKLPALEGEAFSKVTQEDHDTIEALTALGYDEKDVRKIMKDLPAGLSQKEQIKKALSLLSKK